MQKNILTALSGLILPLAGYAMPAASNTTYQRSYLAASRQSLTADVTTHNHLPSSKAIPVTNIAADELQLVQTNPVQELIIIDSAVPDKALLYKAARPGTAIIELTADTDGLQQLTAILQQYQGLTALHLVSHAEEGALLLGSSHIDAVQLQQELTLFSSLNGALKPGADLLLYGCNLAKGNAGAEFLDILQANTHADLAASNNLTGNSEKGGDWQLEIQRGDINTGSPFSAKALTDFSGVLAPTTYRPVDLGYGYAIPSITTPDNRIVISGLDGAVSNFDTAGSDGAMTAVDTSGGYGNYDYIGARLQFASNPAFTSTFELHELKLCVDSGVPGTPSVDLVITGYNSNNDSVGTANVTVTTARCFNDDLNASQTLDLTATFGSNYDLRRFVVSYDGVPPSDRYFVFKSVTLDDIQAPDTTPPTVSSINRVTSAQTNATSVEYTVTFSEDVTGVGTSDFTLTSTGTASGTIASVTSVSASTYTVTVNTISGDGLLRLDLNNAGTGIADSAGNAITTGFTGGQTYTIDQTAPAAPSAPDLTAASDTGSSSTDDITNDTTPTFLGTAEANSTVTVISSLSGTLGTTTANGAGNWLFTSGATVSGTHTITATATDAVGNISAASSGLSITIDTTAPTVTDANISISGGTGSGGTYIIGDTVTATWNNTTGGDNNSDSISNVTFDFSQFGGGAAVAATNSANTWTASYTVAAGAIEASGRNVSVTATDNAGNATTRADMSNAAVDNAAPTVANVSVPANATYITGQNLDFTVNIAGLSDVVVNTAGGTPRIALTIGAATRYASFVSGSASPFLTFRYTVQSGDVDANGIAVAGVIDANGGTLQDGSGNDMNLTLNAVSSTASVLVDAVAPTISSVSVPAADTYLVGETLSFTVNTTENVTVSTGGGTPHLPLTIGATAREAVYVSGSSTSALVFSYTVQAGDNDGDGIAIGASAVLDGGTMRDAAGNDLTLTLNTVGDTSGVLVDTAAPTLQTLSPADDSATAAANANFVMTFSEDITLGAGDITFYDSLNVQAAVIDVASHGGQLSITGNELTINPTADLSESTSYYIHVDNGAVTDLAGIAYAGIADSTSWNFTVADVTPPTVTSITVAGSPSASAEAIQFTVTFDEVPANISVSDFTLTPSGAGVSGNIASNSPVNLNTVTVTIDQITGTGTLRLDVNASSGITDTLGNGNGTNGFVPAFTSGDLHTVDREAPGVPTGLSLDAASDSGTPGDAVTNDNTPTINGTADTNVTVEVSSDVDGVLGTTTSDASGDWSFTPGAAMTDGAHNLTATAADTAGNESAASSALAIEVDTAAPTAGIDMADTTLIAGEASSVTITFSEAILGFTNDDLTIANGTLTNVSSSDGNVTWTATFTPAADTTSAVNLISLDLTGVTDAAGNAGAGTENSANYTIDTLRPTATIVVANAELLTGETSLVTITFDEVVSGFDNNDLTILFGSLDAVVSSDGGITWTATFTPDSDIYELDNVITLDNSGVVDAAGNTGSGITGSNGFTVRTLALTLLVTSDLDAGDDETTAVILVDDEADGNGLSLREALFWARAGDTITFDLDSGTAGNQGGTITLNGSELAVNHNNLIIDGDLNDDGTPDITLSGNNVSRIMRVASGSTGIELVGLTLTQGAGNGGGGGLALDINTDTTLRDSTITDNHELGWGGGGIYGSSATMRIINSTISGNSSDSFGGGIRLVGNGVLHLLNSTVSNNTTSGAGAHGAGIQYAGPDLLVVNTTISGNAAMGVSAIGGGLRISGGTSTVYNSTIVGNVAGNSAGGVSANGTNDVFVNTVVAGNAAGAGAMAGASGSPLATGGSASDAIGTVEVATNSYFGTSATITTDNNSLNNQGTLDLLLGNLADNGGSVMTHRPMAGSALSDAGSNADLPADTYDLDSDTNVAEALPVDALGASRVSGAAVDIGAVEGNRAPVLLDLGGGNTHVEDGVAVVIDNDVTVTDDELDGLNGGNGNYNGASVTIARNGGADASDTFGFMDGSGMSLVAGELIKNGQVIATFDTATAGQLVVTYTDTNGEVPERSDVNAMLQQITYASTSNDPDTSVQLDWIFTDEAGAPVTETASVTISPKNDAPVVTATGGTPIFTENGTAVDLFSAVSISPVETAQSIVSLQLTVTGANNGSDEILAIDGSDVVLAQSNTLVTATNALHVSVALAETTATVTLSHATGITGTAAQAVIDGMTYRNTSENPNPLSRVVTLSGVQDNGGVVNDGADTTSLSIAATITISAINNAPTISGTPVTVTDQNAPYSFTPSAADVDSDTLTFSIANQPAWTSFDTATGTLSGVPAQADVGTATNIVISVSDSGDIASLPAFSLTVVDINDAPTIAGTPAVSVDQDMPYSFIPTATDPDGDALTFNIMNKPVWATFNTTTGALNGTPLKEHVGTTNDIVISVSDGTVSTNLVAFNLTVVNTNQMPEISGTPLIRINEDEAYSFVPTASDPDGDSLAFSITNKPIWASFDTATGALTGTPAKEHVGTTSGIVISVSDGEFTASLNAFNLQVINVNTAPVAVDDNFSLPFNNNATYTLDVIANDTDPDDDSLTITAAKASIGLVSVQNNKLLFTAPDNFSGTVSFSYNISDGELTDMAKVTLQIDGSNPDAPVITAPDDLVIDATGLFTKVDVGVATAVDSIGNRLAVSLVNGLPMFSAGHHELYWRATDAGGRSSTVTQLLQINPLVSLSKPQTVINNSSVGIDVILNGPAPVYPVEVAYTVSGSAQSLAEHDLVSGTVQIQSGTSARINFNVFADLATVAEKDVVITLDNSLNLGANASTTVSITEANLAPDVSLTASQQGISRLTFAQDGEEVIISALATDPNPGDSTTLQWQADSALLNLSGNSDSFIFDPATVAAGVYRVAVTATDSASPALSNTAELYLQVLASLPVLTDADTNNNLIPDNVEGLGDANGNGIPDYLDPGYDCNVIPEQISSTSAFVAEGEPGICLRKGAAAAQGSSGGIELNTADQQWLEPDMQAVNIGGLFDFILLGLPTAGDSYSLVLPQREPLPQNAIYRKYTSANGWTNFVVNERNQLFSAAGEPGFCPPPGDTSWQSGLTAGHWCVQLHVEDGGPNDADGVANGSIVDPGGVAVILDGNSLPAAANDSYSLQWNQSHMLEVLQNDTDADGDTLSINQASAAFGTVSISEDGHSLWYTPDNDFVGPDTLNYSVTDGKGGSASASVAVTVYYNRAPAIADSTASTDDKTAIVLDVLTAATDADGDTLTISSASAEQGTVSITTEQTLRYEPRTGFGGTDVISFTISDSRGGEVQANIRVTVTAHEVITVVNKSSGGAVNSWPLLLLACMAVIRQRKLLLKPLLILAVSLSFTVQASWSVDAFFGKSTTKQPVSDISQLLPDNAELLQYDDSGKSWALGLSYYFTPRLAMQAHYVDLGDASVSMRGETLTPEAFHQALSDIGPMLAKGVRSGLSYHVWQHAGWSATVQAGVFAWNSETSSNADDKLIRYKSSDTDIYWALGANYALDQHLMLHTTFTRYHLEGNKADNIMLGISYHF